MKSGTACFRNHDKLLGQKYFALINCETEFGDDQTFKSNIGFQIEVSQQLLIVVGSVGHISERKVVDWPTSELVVNDDGLPRSSTVVDDGLGWYSGSEMILWLNGSSLERTTTLRARLTIFAQFEFARESLRATVASYSL